MLQYLMRSSAIAISAFVFVSGCEILGGSGNASNSEQSTTGDTTNNTDSTGGTDTTDSGTDDGTSGTDTTDGSTDAPDTDTGGTDSTDSGTDGGTSGTDTTDGSTGTPDTDTGGTDSTDSGTDDGTSGTDTTDGSTGTPDTDTGGTDTTDPGGDTTPATPSAGYLDFKDLKLLSSEIIADPYYDDIDYYSLLVETYSGKVNGDTIVFQHTVTNSGPWAGNGQYWESGVKILSVNGKPVDENSADIKTSQDVLAHHWESPGPLYGIYSVNGTPKGFYTNYVYTNYVDFGRPTNPTPQPSTDFSISEIPYGYTVVNADGTAFIFDSDGTAHFDASSGAWTANLGEVKLDGSLNGYEVSGTATLDSMSGEFSGTATHSVIHDLSSTHGGFAGDDDTGIFAGMWGKEE